MEELMRKKNSRSRLPEKFNRAKKENALNNRDQDHQKGKNAREVVHDL